MARTSTIRAIIRGLTALIALIAVLAGVPAGLLNVGVLPQAVPSWQQVSGALTSQDNGQLFLGAVTVIGWVGWASFVVSAALETVAALRHRTARRIPGLGGAQKLAGSLVGGVILLLPASGAFASSPAAAVPAQTAPHTPPPAPAQHGPAAENPKPALPTGPVHRAAANETLWDIAEERLGDGTRWREIVEHNPEHSFPDGRVDADVVLALPADASPTAPAEPGPAKGPDLVTHAATASQAPAATTSYTVVPGDSLSQIAEDELGDAAKYPKVFEMNKGEPQPGGRTFTDPDLIYPGQELDLPARQISPDAPAPEQEPETGDDGEQPDHADPGDAAPPPDPHSPAPGPSDQTRETEPAFPPASESSDEDPAGPAVPGQPSATGDTKRPDAPSGSPAPSTGRDRDADTRPQPADGIGIPLHITFGIAALLAASLLGGLGLKRVLQQRRRRVGETIAMPAEASRLEQALQASAEPASVELLDTALRTMAHHARRDGRALPALRGARVTGRTVELLIDGDQQQSHPPFTSGEGGWWTLSDPDAPLDVDTARTVPAPYPGLVTVGTDPDGNILLLHLPQARAVLLDGDIDQVRAVTRAIALEAATCAWADHAEIVCVGSGAELATLLPHSRIRAMPHLAAAVQDLGELALEAHQATEGTRANEAAPAIPWILVCVDQVDPEQAWQLADAVAKARHIDVAVVLPAAGIQQCFPDAERLNAGSVEAQDCGALGTSLVVQRMGDDAYEQFLEQLRTAEEPARPAEGAWQLVPDPDARPPRGPVVPDSIRLHAVPDPDATAYPALLAPADPSSVTVLPHAPTPDQPGRGDAAAPGHVGSADTTGADQEPAQESAEPVDLRTPHIRVLGPVAVSGIELTGHGGKLAALAALLYFRPGRDADTLCEAMDPISPWARSTLYARMSELRNRLGHDPDGTPYLPREHSRGYRLSGKVRCDWTHFQTLADCGLTKGSPAGLADLETALDLVRGKPFSGNSDYPWATPLVQDITSRIVDIAHTVATWRTSGPTPDHDAARRAIAIGLEVDETAELLYRDWIRLEDQAGNRAGVHAAIEQLQAVNQRLDIDMEPSTERTINYALNQQRQGHRA